MKRRQVVRGYVWRGRKKLMNLSVCVYLLENYRRFSKCSAPQNRVKSMEDSEKKRLAKTAKNNQRKEKNNREMLPETRGRGSCV